MPCCAWEGANRIEAIGMDAGGGGARCGDLALLGARPDAAGELAAV
jgi:hypothetical protein